MKLLTKRHSIKLITILCIIAILVSALHLSIFSFASSPTVDEYVMTFDEAGVSDFYTSNTLGSNFSIIEANGSKVLKYTGAYNRQYAHLYNIDAYNSSTETDSSEKIKSALISHTEGAVYNVSFKYRVVNPQPNYGVSVTLAVVGYGSDEVSKTDNKNKGIAYKQLINTKTACEWTEYQTFLTLDATGAAASAEKKYGIAFGGYITGSVYIDDVKITKYTDIPSSTVFVNTDTDLGGIAVNNNDPMPTPTKSNLYFVGWYADEDLTEEFDISKYSGGQMVNAYAKWSGTVQIDVEKTTVGFDEATVPNYYPESKTSVSRNPEFSLATEDNNRFIRYTSGEYSEKYVALYDPDKISDLTAPLATGTRNYSLTVSNTETNNKVLYRVSFKYRVNSLAGGVVKVSFVTFNAQNVWGISTTTELLSTPAVTENGWQNATTDIYVDASTANWNAKCFGLKVYGNAQVDIDDFTIEDYTSVKECILVTFDTQGGSTMSPQFVDLSKNVIPTPSYSGKTFVGWTTDADGENLFNPEDYNRNTDGFTLKLYAKWSSDTASGNIIKYTASFEEQGVDMIYANDNSCRADKYTLVSDNGNTYMKFSNMDLNAKNAHITNYMAIYDNNKLFQNGAPTSPLKANADAIKYMLLNGMGNKKIYKVSFDYRVNSVMEGKTLSVYFGYAGPANVHGGAQNLSTDSLLDIQTVSENGAWSTHTAYIIIDTSSVNHWANHAVTMALRGYADVDFDNIVLEDYSTSGLKGYLFVTNSSATLEPIFGNTGDPVVIEALSDTEEAKFVGWYTDAGFTNEFAGADKIGDDFVVLYAKWQAIRIVQDFENWPYVLGAMTFDRDMIYNNPSAETYDKSGVHGGKSSIFRNNEMNVTARLMTWQTGMPKLTVGEKYVFRVWIKPVIKRNSSAALSIVLTDSNTSCWGTTQNTTRKVAGYYSKLISQEWNLIEFEFEANRPYLAFEFDGVNTAYIDDISITLKSADDPSKIDYSSAANYNGTKEQEIVYETFPPKEVTVTEDTYKNKVTGKIVSGEGSQSNELSAEESNTTTVENNDNNNYALIIGISAGGAVILAAVVCLVIIIIKKRRGGKK